MVYFDNAATSGVKPKEVIEAVNRSLREFSVNPGRGGYKESVKCSEEIYRCRKKVSRFFGANAPERVIFTANCTTALNTVIKGIVRPGDHVVISGLEHNAVARPLYEMTKSGVKLDIAEVIFGDWDATVRSFERLIRKDTRLVVCTHASNVTGSVLPIGEIGEICAKRGVPFAVDAAQTAGVLPIDMKAQKIDYLCIAPHKGIFAPTGIGVLIALGEIPKTLTEGGTGSMSQSFYQPVDLPERFESGTVNVPGIFGLSAGIDFVENKGREKIMQHELKLSRKIYEGLRTLGGCRMYSEYPNEGRSVPTLSFNLRDIPSTEIAEYLGDHNIAVRAGLHCAPMAHRRLGTAETGTVRVSCSFFNTEREAEYLLNILKNYKRMKKIQKVY